MTVTFTETPVAKPAAQRPPLGSLLAPIIADRVRQTQDPARVLLACYTRGLAARHSAAAVTAYVTAHADDSLRDALSADPGLALALAQRARRHVREVRTAGGQVEMRRRIARRLIARIFSPTPEGSGVGPAMDARSRAVLIVIAARAMEVTSDARASVLVTPGWLGSVVNLSERQAWNVLKVLEKRGWIRRTSRSAGRSLWKLTELEDDDLRQTAWANAGAIDALAADDAEAHPLAAVIMSSAHPAWWFSEGALGPRALLRLAGEHAAAGASIGMGIAPLRRAKAELDRWGLRTAGAAELPSRLDAIAEDTLAHFIAADRAHDAAVESQRQRAKLESFRAERDTRYELRKAARAVLCGVVKTIGATPVGDRTALERWVPQMAATALPSLATALEVGAYSNELAAALARSGWDDEVQTKVCGFVEQQARAQGLVT